jgi:hypothetical protein
MAKILNVHADPEREARNLRDFLYSPISDESWEQVKFRWVNDLPWLREHAKIQADRMEAAIVAKRN